jgi:hypothetical protein
MRCWALLSKEEEKLRLIEGNKSSEVAAMDVVSNVGWNIFNCVFGWGAAGAERSRPAPTAIWMGERLQGDYTPRCGSLHPSKFEGWSCSASVSLYRLSSVSLPSLSLSHVSGRGELVAWAWAAVTPGMRWWPRAAARSSRADPSFTSASRRRTKLVTAAAELAGGQPLELGPRRWILQTGEA